MDRHFLIGEVADLLGVSRDTLRIYEEEGLISPKRDENGYRIYSERDIYYLIGVRFYRDSSIPAESIRELINAGDAEDMLSIIKKKLREEEREIIRHERNVEHLKLMAEYFGERSSRGFTRGAMPEAFRMSEIREDFFDTAKDYFDFGRENGDMLFCYLNTEFDIRAGKRPVRSYLELSGQEIEALGLSDRIMDKNALSAMDCIKLTVCSPVPYPEEEHIDSVINYAVSEGIRLKGTVYAHSMYHLIENGEHLHMVEIYAPVD